MKMIFGAALLFIYMTLWNVGIKEVNKLAIASKYAIYQLERKLNH